LKEEEEEKKNKKKREELVRGHCNFGFSKKGLFCLDSVNLVDFFFLGRADFKRRVRERASERASETDRQRECARAAKERDKSDGDHQRVHGWEVAEGVRRE
jgi:hypothetical protein